MNIVFWLLVGLILIFVWAEMSIYYKDIGSLFYDIFKDIEADEKENEEKGENEDEL